MLERIEAEIRQIRGLLVAEDPEHAAFFLELVHHRRSGLSGLGLLVYGFMQ
jgi:hypothetical protein